MRCVLGTALRMAVWGSVLNLGLGAAGRTRGFWATKVVNASVRSSRKLLSSRLNVKAAWQELRHATREVRECAFHLHFICGLCTCRASLTHAVAAAGCLHAVQHGGTASACIAQDVATRDAEAVEKGDKGVPVLDKLPPRLTHIPPPSAELAPRAPLLQCSAGVAPAVVHGDLEDMRAVTAARMRAGCARWPSRRSGRSARARSAA